MPEQPVPPAMPAPKRASNHRTGRRPAGPGSSNGKVDPEVLVLGPPPNLAGSAQPRQSSGEFEEDEFPATSAPVVRFSLDQHRENTRKNLAFFLVALVAVLLVTMLIKSLWLMKTMQDMTDLLAVLLAPFVGLVGAATGFYYGTKDK